MPDIENSRKNSRKGCRVGRGKTAEKQPEKHPKHPKNSHFDCFSGVSGVFPAVFRLFYRDPLGTLFGCFFGCFQCRAFGTSVAGRGDCNTVDLRRFWGASIEKVCRHSSYSEISCRRNVECGNVTPTKKRGVRNADPETRRQTAVIVTFSRVAPQPSKYILRTPPPPKMPPTLFLHLPPLPPFFPLFPLILEKFSLPSAPPPPPSSIRRGAKIKNIRRRPHVYFFHHSFCEFKRERSENVFVGKPDFYWPLMVLAEQRQCSLYANVLSVQSSVPTMFLHLLANRRVTNGRVPPFPTFWAQRVLFECFLAFFWA